MKPIRRVLSWPFLGLLGIFSGILSVAPPIQGRWALLYVGLVYGLVLGVYFFLCRGVHSATKLSLLILASSFAYPIALLGGQLGIPLLILSPGLGLSLPIAGSPRGLQFLVVFLAGLSGGVALLLPVLKLFDPSPSRSIAFYTKVAAGSLLSAFVGVLGRGLGPLLGEKVWMILPWTLLPNAPTQNDDTFHFIALYLTWQPVLAVFIGAATSGEPQPVGDPDSQDTDTSP